MLMFVQVFLFCEIESTYPMDFVLAAAVAMAAPFITDNNGMYFKEQGHVIFEMSRRKA